MKDSQKVNSIIYDSNTLGSFFIINLSSSCLLFSYQELSSITTNNFTSDDWSPTTQDPVSRLPFRGNETGRSLKAFHLSPLRDDDVARRQLPTFLRYVERSSLSIVKKRANFERLVVSRKRRVNECKKSLW